MEFVQLGYQEKKKINIDDSNTIYFFHNYYKWNYVKNFPLDDLRRKQTSRILNFKKGQHFEFGWYKTCISNHILDFGTEQWIVCSIPSHNQTDPVCNNTDEFISYCVWPHNFDIKQSLILKIKADPEKHLGTYGTRSVDRDLANYKLTESVKNKNVIVIDDTTVSGSSLAAARILLKTSGAKRVVCIAMAKDVDTYYFAS